MKHLLPDSHPILARPLHPQDAAKLARRREAQVERGFVKALAVVFVMVLAVAVIGGALQSAWMAHIEGELADE